MYSSSILNRHFPVLPQFALKGDSHLIKTWCISHSSVQGTECDDNAVSLHDRWLDATVQEKTVKGLKPSFALVGVVEPNNHKVIAYPRVFFPIKV